MKNPRQTLGFYSFLEYRNSTSATAEVELSHSRRESLVGNLLLDVQVFMIRVCTFLLLFLISYAKLPISHDLEDYCDYFILPK